MACDTRKNTVKALLDKKVIDESRTILDLDEFDRLNEIYSETAREKYGVQGGLLFDIQTTKKDRTDTQATQIIHRAVANLPMFEKLDLAVNEILEKPKEQPNEDGLIPKIEAKTTAYKSLKKGTPTSQIVRSPEESARIQSVVIPKMKEILGVLGVKTATVDNLYNQQQEINRLQALHDNSDNSEHRSELNSQIRELQKGGISEETAAFADIMNRLVQFATGEMSDDNLTEETLHFVTDVIEQKYPKLFQSMIDKITQFKVYTQVRQSYVDDKQYQTAEGRPDFPKLKREAIAQLLVQHLLYPEQEHESGEAENFIEFMWQKISDFIKELFNMILPTDREAFRDVAERILHDPAFITKEDAATLGQAGYEAKKPKGAAKVLAKLAYEMREKTEEFKAVMPEWVKTAVKPTFKNNEEQWKFGEQYRKDLTLQSVEVGKNEDGTPLMDNRYFYKGVRLPERTSTVIAQALGKAKGYVNLNKMTEREVLRESKKEKGTSIHKEIQSILNMYIDPDTGLLRDVPLEEIETVHTNLEIFDILDKHLFERLQSYPAGTRFSVELPIVNWLEGYAGTIDFMAIMPDGSTDILDWKSTEIFQRSEWLGTPQAKTDLSPFDQRYWKEQLKLYKRALFHMGFTDFRYTRAIPVATQFQKVVIDKTLPATDLSNIRYDLRSVEIGSHEIKSISRRKNYLIPVSIETELTGKKQLDELLTKLWGLRNRLQNAPHSGEEGIKYSEVERITNAIRELQIRQTANSLVTVFTANFIRYQKLASKEAPFLANLVPGQAFTDSDTEEKVEAYIKDLTDAHDFLKAFKDFASIIRDLYPAGALTEVEESVLNGVQDIEANAAKIRLGIEEKLQIVAATIGDQFGIADVNARDFTANAFRYVFSNLFNREERSIQLFGRVKNTMDAIHHTKINTEIDKVSQLRDGLDAWVKINNSDKMAALAKLRNPDTGRLVAKISPKFWDTLDLQKEVFTDLKQSIVDQFKDVKFRDQALVDKMNDLYKKQVLGWLGENLHLDQFEESYNKRREGYIKYLEETTFHDDPNMDQSKKEQQLAQWEKSNDIYSYPEALRPGNNSIRVQEEKWFTPEFQDLVKKDAAGNLVNKELFDLYTYFQGLNIRAINNGMMDDIWRPTTFTPQIERSNLGYRFHQSMLNKIKSFKYLYLYVTSQLKNTDQLSNEAVESDLLNQEEEIDPVTNRRVQFIPTYYKRLGEGKQLEPDMFHSFAKWAEHIATYESVKEFEQRLSLARVVEALKTETIDTNLWGTPQRKTDDPTILKAVTKSGSTASLLESYIDRYVYNRNESADVSPAMKAAVDGLYTYTMLKYLGANVPAYISNVVGGAVRRRAVMLNYTKVSDMAVAQRVYAGVSDPLVKAAIGNIEDIPEKSAFLRHLFYTNISDQRDFNDYTRDFGQGWKHSESKATISSWALSAFKIGDNFIQDPIAIALFMNATFVDGKLVNIPTYVRSLHPDKYQLSQKEQKRVNKEISDKIEELRKQNLFTLVEGEDGDYKLKGFDPESPEGKTNALMLSNLARSLTKDALGNSSLSDVSQARMNYWMRIPLQFKNWMPWQMKTIFGKLQYSYEKQALEVGRARALFHMLTHGAALRTTSLLAYNILPGLSMMTRAVGLTGSRAYDKAMAAAGQQIYVQQKEYLRERNQEVPFTEAEMVDLYKNTVDGELRELHAISTFLLISLLAGIAVSKGKDRWYMGLLARTNFMIWNELTQMYDPKSMTYTITHAMPIISAFDDFVNILKAMGGKAVGAVTKPVTTGQLHRRAVKLEKTSHPLYQIINAIPIVRQVNNVLMSHSKRWAHYLGQKQPKKTW